MSGGLRVLAYHRVLDPDARPSPNPALVSATARDFELQMAHLVRHYRVVSLPEVLEAQRGGTSLPARAVLLTFDDAYRDFGEVVWPILSHHGLPATVFVPTAYPDHPERAFWWDRAHHAIERTKRSGVRLAPLGELRLDSPAAREASLRRIQQQVKSMRHRAGMRLIDDLCAELGVVSRPAGEVLGWDELRALADQGVSLVPHTRTHAALTRLDPEDVSREMAGSAADLRRETGSALPIFCYPFGLHDETVVAAARRAGFELAFTCLDGHNRLPAREPLRLRRTVITRRTSPLVFGLRLWKLASYVDMWRHRSAARPPAAAPDPERPQREHAGTPKIAYVMSRFPKLSETFVLNEMVALESMGVDVELYPLLRERQPVAHPEVNRWTERARFQPFLSPRILRAQAHFLRRAPATYLRTLHEVLRGTWGSRNFFVGALGIYPKSVRFAYEMQREGVTHVHAHFCTHPAVAALIVHRLTGIPYSFTAHGSDLHVERRMLNAKVAAARFAVTISRFNREVIVAECGDGAREKVHVVHCGVDPGYFTPSRAAPSSGAFRIVCVASLEEVKGHRYLLEACRLLRERGRDFRCDLVGDGPLRHELSSRVERLGLRDRVHLHGGKPRPEVARMLGTAHAAVLASHPTADGKKEGIPVALMEAMAAGLPVIATAISGIPELVEDGVTGVLVPSGDARALADALDRLMEEGDLRAAMGSAGREKVLREFDLEANTRRLMGLFSGAAPSTGGEVGRMKRSPVVVI